MILARLAGSKQAILQRPTASFGVVRRLLEKSKSHCKLLMSEWRRNAKAHVLEVRFWQMSRIPDRVPASQEAAPLRFNFSLGYERLLQILYLLAISKYA